MQWTPNFKQSPGTAQNASPNDDPDNSSVSSRKSVTAPSASANRGRGKVLLVTLMFLVSLGAGFLGGWVGSASQSDSLSLTNDSNMTRQKQNAQSDSQLIASIAETVGPSVVSVNVVTESSAEQDIFGFPVQSRPRAGAGTGIIISSDGLIVTNRHVVPQGITNVSITLSDGTDLEDVEVVGRTNESDSLDVAFLKVNDLKGKNLTPAKIGDSGDVVVGDVVVAIGNALGQFNNTVTSGIISGYGRSVVASSDGTRASAENLTDLFQTDAAINQGNSGGPLVNIDGQVIGINTAVAGDGQNIGFAIPINDVNGLIKQVLRTGKFERPYLGVRYIRLSSDLAKEYDVKVQQGAYIPRSEDGSQSSVLEDGPAAKAGLRGGDVITAIDGRKIDQNTSLNTLISQKAVGDQVKVTVNRDGRTVELNATLGALPNN